MNIVKGQCNQLMSLLQDSYIQISTITNLVMKRCYKEVRNCRTLPINSP